jgi:hypothetical protein
MVCDLIDDDAGACLITIRELITSDDRAKRSAGVWALGFTFAHVGISPDDYNALETAADDADEDLRAIALGTLSGLKKDRSYARMVAGLADPDTQVRVSAASGLGYSGRPEAIPARRPCFRRTAGDSPHPDIKSLNHHGQTAAGSTPKVISVGMGGSPGAKGRPSG